MTIPPEVLPPTTGDERLAAAWKYHQQKSDRLVELWTRYFQTPWEERPALRKEIAHARTMIDGATDELCSVLKPEMRLCSCPSTLMRLMI